MIHALAITGPTASGKTAISLGVAERMGCEIISCDSMQIYREMDIGTAKATKEEQRRVPHHLIDFLSPSERYSAEDYLADATAALNDIVSRGRIPLFVGGTGLYIDTVIRGDTQCAPPSSPEVRDRLTRDADIYGSEYIWQRLREVDPVSADAIHPNNVRRVIRALEIYEISGRTKTYYDSLTKVENDRLRVGMITLDFHNRDNLYSRVDARVDAMMEMGLLDEVRRLYSGGMLAPDTTASQAIGYKEFIDYLEGRCTLMDAVETLKLSSRRYAKRQLTWFRRKDAVRMYVDTEDGIIKGREALIDEAVGYAETFIDGREPR